MKHNNMTKFNLDESVRHTDNMFIKNGLLYKYFTDCHAFEEEKERNIDFLLKHDIPNIPKIKKKIYEKGHFIGYVIEYIPNTITFRQAINSDIDYEKKENAIINVFNTLKELHANKLFLGDIHSDNFLISKTGDGYIIDLEEMRGEGDEFKFKSLYLIQPNNKSLRLNISSEYTDNVKLMITAISLLYDIDLELFIDETKHSINLEKIYNEVIINFHDEKLDTYFEKLINKEKVGYFSEYYFDNNMVYSNKKRA